MTTFQIPLLQLQTFFIIFARVAAILMSIPVFSTRNVPVLVKAGLAFSITLVLFPMVSIEHKLYLDNIITFGIGVAGEVMLGVAIGLFVKMIFAGIQLAGSGARRGRPLSCSDLRWQSGEDRSSADSRARREHRLLRPGPQGDRGRHSPAVPRQHRPTTSMSHTYKAVGWNRQKRIYDLTLVGGILLYLALFVVVTLVLRPNATIETALMGCPMVVAYKTSPLTYAIAKRVVRVPHIGMVNIVAGREVCPELIQAAATPAALARELQPLLSESDRRTAMKAELSAVSAKLGNEGAYQQAAGAIARALGVYAAGS